MNDYIEEAQLHPVESFSLTVGLAQVLRGEEPSPNIAVACILTLARLANRHDWTAEDATAGSGMLAANADTPLLAE